MKSFKLVLVLCVLMMGLMVAPAKAEKTGMYLGVKFIDSIQTMKGEDESRGANTVGGALFAGYDFNTKYELPIRAELEYALRSDLITRGFAEEVFFNAQTLLANFYFDFHNSSDFTPYVGAGLGLAFTRMEADTPEWSNLDANSTNFAWQVGAGVSYAFNETISADLGYRFVSFGSSHLEDEDMSTSVFSSAHEFSLGVRFSF